MVFVEQSPPVGRATVTSLSCPHLSQLGCPASSSPEPAAPACAGMQQPWQLRRPTLQSCPKLKRRQLRSHLEPWTLEEVKQHRYPDDAWIAVDGKVYDITSHIVDHPGWDTGCGISTILSILAHAGSECTQEFIDIHRSYPIAFAQLRAYYIGELAKKE